MNLSPRKQLFVNAASEMFGNGSIVNKQQVREASDKADVPLAGWFMRSCKTGYNQFKLPSEEPTSFIPTPTVGETVNATVNLVATNMEKQNLVPSNFEGFVPWGHHSTIKQVVKSGLFYPIFVTGLSGNGKTCLLYTSPSPRD